MTLDSELGQISTPRGLVDFLQVVGVTAAEQTMILERSVEAVLERFAEEIRN